MNAVETILRYVDVFRRFKIPVTFEPGWDTRGNGSTANYLGALAHHTATPFSDTRPQALVTGRPDLTGPLCNLAGLMSGGIHVVAAHPANHAGASGGPSMGPLPTTRAFNALVVGLEIVYPGTTAMTAAQYRTLLVYILATAEIFGSVERCRGHWETSIEGKPDPAWSMNPWRPYDMSYMRREALTLQEAKNMTPAEMDDLVNRIYGRSIPLKQYPSGVVAVSLQGSLEYDDYRAQSNGAKVDAVAKVVNVIGSGVAELLKQAGNTKLDPAQFALLQDDLEEKLNEIEQRHRAELERLRAEHAAAQQQQAEQAEQRLEELAQRLEHLPATTILAALREFYAPAVAAATPQA